MSRSNGILTPLETPSERRQRLAQEPQYDLASNLHRVDRSRGVRGSSNPFQRGVQRGVENLQTTGYGLIDWLGEAVGDENVREWAQGNIENSLSRAALNPAEISNFTEIDTFADLGTYVLETLGEFAPQAVTMIGGGGVGVAVRAGIGKKLAQEVTKAAARRASTTGAVATSYPQLLGETQLGALNEGETDPLKVFGASLAKLGLEIGPVDRFSSILFRASRELPTNVRDVARHTMRDATVGATAEGLAEGGQALVDEALLSHLNNRDFMEDQDIVNFWDQAIRGSVAGGAMAGGLSLTNNTARSLANPPRVNNQERLEDQRADDSDVLPPPPGPNPDDPEGPQGPVPSEPRLPRASESGMDFSSVDEPQSPLTGERQQRASETGLDFGDADSSQGPVETPLSQDEQGESFGSPFLNFEARRTANDLGQNIRRGARQTAEQAEPIARGLAQEVGQEVRSGIDRVKSVYQEARDRFEGPVRQAAGRARDAAQEMAQNFAQGAADQRARQRQRAEEPRQEREINPRRAPTPSSPEENNFSAAAFIEGRQQAYVQTQGEKLPAQIEAAVQNQEVEATPLSPETTNDPQTDGAVLYTRPEQTEPVIQMIREQGGIGGVQGYGTPNKPERPTFMVIPQNEKGERGSPVLADISTLSRVQEAQQQRVGERGMVRTVPASREAMEEVSSQRRATQHELDQVTNRPEENSALIGRNQIIGTARGLSYRERIGDENQESFASMEEAEEVTKRLKALEPDVRFEAIEEDGNYLIRRSERNEPVENAPLSPEVQARYIGAGQVTSPVSGQRGIASRIDSAKRYSRNEIIEQNVAGFESLQEAEQARDVLQLRNPRSNYAVVGNAEVGFYLEEVQANPETTGEETTTASRKREAKLREVSRREARLNDDEANQKLREQTRGGRDEQVAQQSQEMDATDATDTGKGTKRVEYNSVSAFDFGGGAVPEGRAIAMALQEAIRSKKSRLSVREEHLSIIDKNGAERLVNIPSLVHDFLDINNNKQSKKNASEMERYYSAAQSALSALVMASSDPQMVIDQINSPTFNDTIVGKLGATKKPLTFGALRRRNTALSNPVVYELVKDLEQLIKDTNFELRKLFNSTKKQFVGKDGQLSEEMINEMRNLPNPEDKQRIRKMLGDIRRLNTQINKINDGEASKLMNKLKYDEQQLTRRAYAAKQVLRDAIEGDSRFVEEIINTPPYKRSPKLKAAIQALKEGKHEAKINRLLAASAQLARVKKRIREFNADPKRWMTRGSAQVASSDAAYAKFNAIDAFDNIQFLPELEAIYNAETLLYAKEIQELRRGTETDEKRFRIAQLENMMTPEGWVQSKTNEEIMDLSESGMFNLPLDQDQFLTRDAENNWNRRRAAVNEEKLEQQRVQNPKALFTKLSRALNQRGKTVVYGRGFDQKERGFIETILSSFKLNNRVIALGSDAKGRVLSELNSVSLPPQMVKAVERAFDSLGPDTPAAYVPMKDFAIIIVDDRAPRRNRMVAIGHELGHVIFNSLIRSSDTKINSRDPETFVEQMIREGNFTERQQAQLRKKAKEYAKQDLEFEEWFADQAAGFMNDGSILSRLDKDSPIGRFFARLKDFWNKFLESLPPKVRARFKTTQSMKKFFKTVIEKEMLAGVEYYDSHGHRNLSLKDYRSALKKVKDLLPNLKRLYQESSYYVGFNDSFMRGLSTNLANIFKLPPQGEGTSKYTVYKKDSQGKFKPVTGTSTLGWLDAKDQQYQYWLNQFRELMGEDVTQWDNWLNDNVINAKQVDSKFKALMDKMHAYLKPRMGNRLGKIQDYKLTRIYDVDKMLNDKEGFMNILREHLRDSAGTLYSDQGAYGERILESIYNSMIHEGGLDPYDVFAASNIQAVAANASRQRTFKDIPDKVLEPFMAPPGVRVLSYIKSGTHRAEFEARAGGQVPISRMLRKLQRESKEGQHVNPQLYKFVHEAMKGYKQKLKTWEDSRRQIQNKLARETNPTLKRLLKNQLKNIDNNKPVEKHIWDPTAYLDQVIEQEVAPEKRKQARRAVDGYLGRLGVDMPIGARKLQSYLMTLQVFTTLLFAAPASVTDIGNVLVRERSFKNLFKNIGKAFDTIKNYEQANEFARALGIAQHEGIINILHGQYGQSYADPKLQRVTEGFFKYTGLEHLTRYTRVLAARLGTDFVIEHGKKAAEGDTKSIEYLKELGIDADMVAAWEKAGRPTEMFGNEALNTATTKVVEAINRWANEGTLRPDAAQRPNFANDMRWQLVWQLKGFFYAFGYNTIGGIFRETKKRYDRGDNALEVVEPAALAMVTLLPLAAIGLMFREFVKYGFDEDEKPTSRMGQYEYIADLFDRAGGLGPMLLVKGMFDAEKYGGSAVVSLLGPTAGHVEEIFKDGPIDSLDRAVPIHNQLNGQLFGIDYDFWK